MMQLGRPIRAIVSAEMRTRERSVIRVTLAVIAVGAVAGGARAAQADLTEAALVLLVTVLAVGTLGFPSGIAAAIVGFLALNWLFTEPTGSFKIHRTDDIVALAVFAASAALVGWTVQRLSTLRRTALQREAEAKVRLDLTNRLLTGADVDDALHSAPAGTRLAPWSRSEPEERRALLETISDESERLERLVRNTLELSRIRAGALDIDPERVDIADLVQHAVRRLRPIARAHRVRLDVDDDLPPVSLDVMMAEQILLNLLENALRFAPPGSEIVVGAHVDGRD